MKELSPQLKEIIFKLFASEEHNVKLPWWKQVITFQEFDTYTYTEEELNQQIEEALSKIKYPIVELCEWLLVNDIERIDNDTWKFECGIEIIVSRIYHVCMDYNISPKITNTKEEYSLLLDCILESINNTLKRSTKFNREQIGKYLEEKNIEI